MSSTNRIHLSRLALWLTILYFLPMGAHAKRTSLPVMINSEDRKLVMGQLEVESDPKFFIYLYNAALFNFPWAYYRWKGEDYVNLASMPRYIRELWYKKHGKKVTVKLSASDEANLIQILRNPLGDIWALETEEGFYKIIHLISLNFPVDETNRVLNIMGIFSLPMEAGPPQKIVMSFKDPRLAHIYSKDRELAYDFPLCRDFSYLEVSDPLPMAILTVGRLIPIVEVGQTQKGESIVICPGSVSRVLKFYAIPSNSLGLLDKAQYQRLNESFYSEYVLGLVLSKYSISLGENMPRSTLSEPNGLVKVRAFVTKFTSLSSSCGTMLLRKGLGDLPFS